MPANRTFASILCAVLGILLFSTKAVFVKLAYQFEVDSISLLLLRMLFALPFYLGMVLLDKNRSNIARRDTAFIFLAGFLGYYLASFLDFEGLKYVKASIERLILFTYPTLVVLLSFIFLKKRISKGQFFAIIMSYVGTVVVFFPELGAQESDNVVLGGVLVFLSGLSYAAFIVSSSWIIPRIGAKTFTSYCMTVSSVLVILHYAFQVGEFQPLLDLYPSVYLYGILMAVVSTIIPSYLVSYAIAGIGANRFALFGGLCPISTIVMAFFILGELLSAIQILGGVIVILSIFIGERFKAKE